MPVVLSFAVLRATGSAGQLGLVLAGQGAVVTLAGGLAGDRFPRGRRRILNRLPPGVRDDLPAAHRYPNCRPAGLGSQS
jgi:hypothetical protein